ncbi:MAG: mechanosensitive ion channel [Syntrophobacterales bacterium]|jgi:small-conductance mechanosensitive channel
MATFFDPAFFDKLMSRAQEYFFQHVLSWAMAVQVVVIIGAVLLAHKLTQGINAWFTRLETHCLSMPDLCAELPLLKTFKRVINSFLAFVLIWIAFSIAGHYHWPRDGLYTAGIILMALTLVRLFTREMKNRFWARILAGALWLLAALYIFHLIEPWFKLLRHITFDVDRVHLSLFQITRALLVLLLLYWLAKNLAIVWRFWLVVGSGLSPAIQILLSRLGSIFLYTASVILVLTYLGLDLTVFALFSGALGLGLGFGLQKVFANLVSGFILLADKSIKPGDVIQMGDSYGWINFLGSRYVSVITRDATEHLIPNETLITGEVVNWSYSENLVRLNVPVGVAYGSDLEQVRDLMLEAAAAIKRVLKEPQPSFRLMGFGDNAINVELRIWINDPQHGIHAVKSELFWGIWQRFREHGIEIPYPQRDLHLKDIPETKIRTGAEEQ